MAKKKAKKSIKKITGAPPIPPRPKKPIASRVYRFKSKPVTLKIFQPIEVEKGASFCHAAFDGKVKVSKFKGAFGVDSLQSLSLSLSMAETILRHHADEVRIDYGKVLGPVGEIGLPLTLSGTDFLTKDDTKQILDLYFKLSEKRWREVRKKRSKRSR